MRKKLYRARHVVSLALALSLLMSWFALPRHFWNWIEPRALAGATFTVNETGDAGDINPGDGVCDSNTIRDLQCTLRAAIQEANATPGLDTINFSIASGAKSITPTSALPIITAPVIIDATTQPGFAGTPLIELNGSGAGVSADGLVITAGNSTVKGLYINRFLSGIKLASKDSNIIQGNYIGQVGGTITGLGNRANGVSVDSAYNTIGGTTLAERNVISGNNQAGVLISCSPPGSCQGNQIQGNSIGTTFNGTAALGNQDGVLINAFGTDNHPAPASFNVIGGTSPGAGNVISGNSGNGVKLSGDGVGNTRVQGNYIGTDVNGTAELGNGSDGVLIQNAPNNNIGGTEAGARNVVSGNRATGIEISGSNAAGNRVQGNYIGTSGSGTSRLANNDGVSVVDAPNNLIGGTTGTTPGGPCTGACNVISGNFNGTDPNHGDGIKITGSAATNNTVQGNFIGTDANGAAAVRNSHHGIFVNASSNLFGGTDDSDGTLDGVVKARNIISGNGLHGVSLNGATNNLVQGNFIGTDATGIAPLSNSTGVYICGSSNGIGGLQAGAANTIANNGTGLFIGCPGVGNSVLFNSIYNNFGLGIDLFPAGVTQNDPGGGDGDSGANNLQNFPVLTSAKTLPATTLVELSLNSTASSRFRIEFFANNACDSSGYGEGQTFLNYLLPITDASGDYSATVSLPPLPAGQFITATATRLDASGNPTDTSEFSQCRQVVVPGVLQFSASTYSVNENGGSATITITRTGGSDGNVSVNYATSNGTAIAGSDYTTAAGTLGFGDGEVSRTFTVPIIDDALIEGNETINLTLSTATGGAVLGTPGTAVLTMVDNDSPVSNVQFSTTSYSVAESAGFATMTVTRTGDTSTAVTVDFETSDVSARQRTDYTLAAGTVTFAAGDPSKTFRVLIVDDVYMEGNETLNLTLSNSTGGAVLGSPSAAVLTITDNDSTSATTNPLDGARFFVQQHYYDFLSRYPDSGGWDFWTNSITSCGTDPVCINNRRIDVSNAFYYELEFQQTGSYVYRLYRAAFGNNQPFPNPNPDPLHPGEERKVPLYLPFIKDRARVRGGAQLAQFQLALASAFVERAEFTNKYATGLNGPGFVDALLGTINTDLGVNLTSQRQALIDLFNAGGRGSVLYRLADDNVSTNPINNRAFIDAEYNRAFVFTQYAGYLRRNPDMPGFLFWLGQVNGAPLRDVPRQHAMVCAFITSAEYQQRFSSVVTHSNTECVP